MTPHFNGLTAAEDERLALLAEECAEVIQVITKIQRHGYESRNPLAPHSPTNRQLLEKEIGDIHVAGTLLVSAGDVRQANIEDAATQKANQLPRWLHHQLVKP